MLAVSTAATCKPRLCFPFPCEAGEGAPVGAEGGAFDLDGSSGSEPDPVFQPRFPGFTYSIEVVATAHALNVDRRSRGGDPAPVSVDLCVGWARIWERRRIGWLYLPMTDS